MQCAKCDADVPDGASFCPECGAAVENEDRGAAVEQEDVGSGAGDAPVDPGPATRDTSDASLVYPKNPPLSPHLAWISVVLPGLAQLVFGQVAKGIVICVGFVVLLVIPIFALAVLVASIVDGYMVGKRLYAGKPVEKWQFFPQG